MSEKDWAPLHATKKVSNKEKCLTEKAYVVPKKKKKKNKFLGLAKPSVCFSKEIPVPTDSGTRADDRQQSPMSLLSSLTA